MDPFRFSEVLASRLCHDLITPIGATQTGLELLSDTSPTHSTDFQEILNLILQSTASASSRTSFFRAAFGKSGDMCSLGDLQTLVKNYFAVSKLKINWEGAEEEQLPEACGRLVLNALLWLGDCAPHGGVLTVSYGRSPHSFLKFTLTADPILLHDGMREAVEGTAADADLTPRTVPCFLLHHLVEEKRGKLALHPTPSSADLSLELSW